MGFVKYVNVPLLLFIIIQVSLSTSDKNQLNSYLKDRYYDVKIKLTENFNKHYRGYLDTYTDIIVHDTHTFYLPSIPVCFNMLNNTYILMNNQVFILSITEDAYLFEPHSVLPAVNHKISFVQVMELNNMILAIVVFRNGFSNIYTYEEENWNLMQTLPNAGMVIDVCMFMQDDILYLFVVNNVKYASVPSILYKWTGIKFEENDDILTIEATSISCFKNKNSEILIITQNPSQTYNMVTLFEQIGCYSAGTYLLEVNKGKMRKRHFLNSHNADQVISYVLNGERYILVLNDKIESTVYWWDENHFIKWKHLQEPIHYQKIAVYYIRNNPLLFAATEDQLVVYNLDSQNLNIIANIPHQKYYWKVLTLDFALIDDQIIIYLIGLDEENYPEMLFLSVSFETSQLHSNTAINEDTVIKCFINLNEKLKFRSDLLHNMKSKSKKILQKNKDEIFKGVVTNHQKVVLKNNTIHNKYPYKKFKQYLPVKDKLKVLQDKVNIVNKQIKQIKGNITIAGKLYVENMKIPEIEISKINNNIWDPNKWLLKSKPQTIFSPVTARNVLANQITTTDKKSELNDLLLIEGDKVLTGNFSFNNLVAENIYVLKINNIPFTQMCRSDGFVVSGKKYIQNISVEKIQATVLNNATTENVLHYLQYNVRYNFYNIRNLNIKKFNFDIINGIYWRDFSYSLFHNKNNKQINGSVIIHSSVKINNLITKKISNISVDQLMTTSTDQNISSDMQLMNVHAENIISSNINGLSLKKKVVTIYDNNYVSGPVTIKNIHVEGDVNGKEFPVQDFKDTNQLHMYDGYVKIIGSLSIKNVSFSASTKLIYKNKLLPHNYIEEYWHKNKEQIISAEITALGGLSVLYLNTTYINDKGFVLYSENYDKDDSFEYKFKNIQVNGDVLLHSNKSLENLEKLFRNAVRKSGRYKIKGHKIFTNTLEIKDLHTAIVDNVEVDNIAKINKFNKFTGTKTFNKLIVEENIILPKNEKLKIREVNNHPIIDLLNRTIYIDRPSYVNNLIFKSNIETSNIIFEKVNDINVNEMTQKLINLYGMDKLEKVFIHGNLDVQVLSTKKANNIDITHYYSQLVSIHDDIEINGDVLFKKDVKINNLKINKINGINIKDASEIYLSRSQDQIVTAVYESNNVQSPFVITPDINNIKTNTLIDITSKEDIHIHSNLTFSSLNCKAANSQFLNSNLQDAVHSLTNLPGQRWKDITVVKDINFVRAGGNFGRIIYHAVNALKNNTLSEKITFEFLYAMNMKLQESEINGVNITELYEDALKNKAEHQVVSGKNIFTKLSAARMKIYGNTNIKNINGVDIIKLNNSIIDKRDLENSVIQGRKQFTEEVEITNLKIPSTVHGVKPENLFQIHKTYENAPNVRFNKIKVFKDCNFKLIKFINITHLISETLKCNTSIPQYIESDLQFTNLKLMGNITTNHINFIDVRNVVVDHGVQYIQNSKKFLNELNIFGDFYVELLNGFRLSSVYNNAILTGVDTIIDHNIIFKKPVGIFANIQCSKINGLEIEEIKSIIESSIAFKTDETEAAFDKLKNILEYYSQFISDDIDITNKEDNYKYGH